MMRFRLLFPLLPLLLLWPGPAAAATSLRFHGNGVDLIDRVRIRIDDLSPVIGGPPADIGATDLTIEFWLRALPGSNPAPVQPCGWNINWIYGHIVFDRDRYNQDRKFGLSLVGGRPIFGVSGDGTGDFTVCGPTDLRNGQWHHVAVERRRSDGHLWLFVDGVQQASVDGPDGDISYPDDGIPGNDCGGPCVESDPFIVLGAEKHDAGAEYPSFNGWFDELRLSTTLRYAGNFTPPAAPFPPDAATAALYHFDEGAGDTINDSSNAPGGPSPGERRFGGTPAGPEWSLLTPFPSAGSVGDDRPAAAPVAPRAAPLPFTDQVDIYPPAGFQGIMTIVDVAGRTLVTRAVPGHLAGLPIRWDGHDDGGHAVPNGLYFARLAWAANPAGRVTTVRLVRLR